MTAKPILRVGKIHSSGRTTPTSVQGHLSRARPTPTASPDRTSQNRWLIGGPGDDLCASINNLLSRAGIDPDKLRKDAVLANDILLTVSPEFFRPDNPDAAGTWDDARLKSFTAEAETLLRKTFGQRVVAAVLHVDEATPHVQAVVVPVMRKKHGQKGHRLSSKDMFDPVRLTALQQEWEDRLRPHGVGRRTKGSRTTHITLREYYGSLEAVRGADSRPGLEISTPPQKRLLEPQETYDARVAAWRADESQRLRQELRPLAVEASRGRLHDAERRRTIELRGQLAAAGGELVKAHTAIGAAQEAARVGKDEVARLRATPLNAVAATLGYTGEIGARENAIDLVKRVGGLDYHSAVAWLAQRFGSETAATAVREHALPAAQAAEKAEPILTKEERTKTRLIGQQLDALAAPSYRVTLMWDRGGERIGKNVGKREDGEKLFTKQEIIGLVSPLTKANTQGANIFITPIDPAAHHVLADDLSAAGLDALQSRGYSPACVVETSPGNHQAILKVPTVAAPKSAANLWFRDLNRDIGDAKITGLAHPFRLAGFANRKEKHRQPDGKFPFVRIVIAVNRLCGRASEIVRVYAARHAAAQAAVVTRSPEIGLVTHR